MQAKNQIKHFTCNLHPSEVIQRVCIDQNAGTSLRCIECILHETDDDSNETMVTLNDFMENAVKQYQTHHKASSLLQNEAVPDEFASVLAEKDEKIQKLSEHIEQEKERVNAAFNIMIQEFTVLCHSKKEEVARQLDKQVYTLKLNYEYYQSKIDQYYKKDKENEKNPDREALINRINQCEDTNHMEVLIKNIKDDLQEAHQDLQLDLNEILGSIRHFAQGLQEQANFVPKSKFCDKLAIDERLEEFREMADSLMEDFVQIKNPISELSFTNFFTIDSEIIEKQDDLNLLKKWLAPENQYCRLKLLYRRSTDGMSNEAFHQKCDNHASTLLIGKSNYGKVFGGFSDQTWDITNNYKASNKTWLFSIDEKQKYPIRPAHSQYAIYTDKNYGPAFGSGYDLYFHLAPQEYQNNGGESYSKLGSAYQIDLGKKKAQRKAKKSGLEPFNYSILAGSHQFYLEELEVYAVLTNKEPTSKSSELDSVIIKPQQDLKLMRN